jgi:hypothetical protein
MNARVPRRAYVTRLRCFSTPTLLPRHRQPCKSTNMAKIDKPIGEWLA